MKPQLKALIATVVIVLSFVLGYIFYGLDGVGVVFLTLTSLFISYLMYCMFELSFEDNR